MAHLPIRMLDPLQLKLGELRDLLSARLEVEVTLEMEHGI